MLVKEKISKIEIYDSKEHHLGTTRTFSFPKSLFKTPTLAISIKCNNIGKIRKGDSVILVFEYLAGSRFRTTTRVDSTAKSQLDVRVGEVTEIEERRRYIKVNTKEKATVYHTKSDKEQGIDAMILNINLGGVLLKCEEFIKIGSEIYLNTLGGQLEIRTKILRRQNDPSGSFIGYGCQFVEISDQQEEILAKYILECQVAERERRKTLDDLGMN